MLRNLLEDYLSSINEREFDYPLSSLLQAIGFYDIHFTHGAVEFGKDFIAKRIEDGVEYQYAIQSKKGDINQSLWRNEIKGQLEEAILSDLSHPQFNSNLPRKVVLATTGRLAGNARLVAQEFKIKLENNPQIQEVIFWEREQLAVFSEKYGLAGIHQNTAQGLKGFAQFYLVYSKAIEGNLSEREIEEFSRLWLDENINYRKRIFRASIEAEIIALKLIESGLLFEAIIIYLSLARIVMQTIHENECAFEIKIYQEICSKKISPLCKEFLEQFKSEWEENNKSLLQLCLKENALPMLQYLVWGNRILEVCSLHIFLEEEISEKIKSINFMTDFFEKEKGCGHIPAERYAVSLVWAALAFIKFGKADTAIELIKRSVIWLCDRAENGFGLARYEADEYEETATLIGYPFECIKVERNTSSFLATVLVDLAAFTGNSKFYADVVNDIAACEIAFDYWQFPDTNSIFTIDSDECRYYPNIPHQNSIFNFENYDYAEHIKHEPKSFQVTQKVGKESLILLSILLRDRYFPTTWKQLLADE